MILKLAHKYFSVYGNWYILQISTGPLDAEHLLSANFQCPLFGIQQILNTPFWGFFENEISFIKIGGFELYIYKYTVFNGMS